MKRALVALLAVVLIAVPSFAAQTPPPAPVTDKKAEPKKPEKGEQEPRPVAQEQQKQDSQKKDAPAPPAATQPSPNPIAVEGAAEKKEDKKWDVNNPPGPQYDVPIDVSEGTWLSLDVSPDCSEITFDLLGDIYRSLMNGAEATSITTCIAWDTPPRCSPNGKW